MSGILAIWSNSNGDPYTGAGRIGHFVRLGASTMAPVDEFNDGGRFPHADCGVAVILSRLHDAGVLTVTAPQIETVAGTGPGGTDWDGMVAALGHYGVASHFAPPPPLSAAPWIMNPAGGRLLDPSHYAAYVAARQGRATDCLEISDPPAPMPAPPGDLMARTHASIVKRDGVTVDPKGAGAIYLVDDVVYGPKRHINGVVAASLPTYLALCGQTQVLPISAFVLDRMELGPEIDLTASPAEM